MLRWVFRRNNGGVKRVIKIKKGLNFSVFLYYGFIVLFMGLEYLTPFQEFTYRNHPHPDPPPSNYKDMRNTKNIIMYICYMINNMKIF